MEKFKKALKMYEDIKSMLEKGIFIPDKLEIKLSFQGDQAEAIYTEHFTYLPEEQRETIIQRALEAMKQKTEKLQQILRQQLEMSFTPIHDGVKLEINGQRSLVLAPLLTELLAQLTKEDTLKTASVALFARAFLPPIWKGDKQ